MHYAVIENGVVTNLIWLFEANQDEFPNAVKLDDRPVFIGDTYQNGVFMRGDEVVQTAAEYGDALSAAYVDLAYENALLSAKA